MQASGFPSACSLFLPINLSCWQFITLHTMLSPVQHLLGANQATLDFCTIHGECG